MEYTYQQAEEYILNIPKFTKKNSSEHTRYLLKTLGDPQNNFKVIHVAGTNGKGSVCAFTSNILYKCGKCTGLFTSPHLVNMTERICINNKEVSKKEFCECFFRVKAAVDKLVKEGYPHPSFFEFLFAMAMDIFARRNVEYAVVETGLGGRLDATNIIDNPIVSVITSIGLDHMEILGDTIEKIAFEKAGIIKKNSIVVFQGENDSVTDIIQSKAKEMNAKCISVNHNNYKIIKKTNNNIDFYPLCGYYLNDIFSVPFISEYQVENAMLAITAVSCIEEIRTGKTAVIDGIASVKWSGRMEQVAKGVYFDGAHNGPGIDQFVRTVKEYKCNGRKNILFSVVKEKDYQYMIHDICSNIRPDKIYITQIDGERSLSAEVIASEFGGYDTFVSEDIMETFNRALNEKTEQDVLFCVGSLYLIGELKKIIKSK